MANTVAETALGVRRLWKLAQGWPVAVLGIAASSLSLIAMIAQLFGVKLAAPNADLLSGYNEFVARLYFFSVEWWTGLTVPFLLKHYVSLHALCAVTEIRRQRHVADLTPPHPPAITFRDGPREVPSIEDQFRNHRNQMVRSASFRAAFLGPLCAALWIVSLQKRLAALTERFRSVRMKEAKLRREEADGVSKQYIAIRERAASRVLMGILPTVTNEKTVLSRQLRALWWDIFWILATPLVVILFFVQNALS